MRGILGAVSAAATLAERIAPLRADPRARRGPPRRRRHARADRAPRRRRPRARADARPADRGRQALRPGRLRQRPAGGDGAADRLARLDHLRRQPRRRDPARRLDRARASTPRWRRGRTRVARLRRGRARATSSSGCACAPRTRTSIAAFHWRGAPDEEAAEAAVRDVAAARRGRRLRHALGPQGPRGAPAGRDATRAAACARLLRRGRTSTPRSTPATTAPTSTPSARCATLVAEGGCRPAVCVGVRSDETPEALEPSADVLVDGPPGVRDLLEALAALADPCASSTCSGRRSCSAPARRRCWRSSPSLAATRDERRHARARRRRLVGRRPRSIGAFVGRRAQVDAADRRGCWPTPRPRR